jgi:hypothetical protein
VIVRNFVLQSLVAGACFAIFLGESVASSANFIGDKVSAGDTTLCVESAYYMPLAGYAIGTMAQFYDLRDRPHMVEEFYRYAMPLTEPKNGAFLIVHLSVVDENGSRRPLAGQPRLRDDTGAVYDFIEGSETFFAPKFDVLGGGRMINRAREFSAGNSTAIFDVPPSSSGYTIEIPVGGLFAQEVSIHCSYRNAEALLQRLKALPNTHTSQLGSYECIDTLDLASLRSNANGRLTRLIYNPRDLMETYVVTINFDREGNLDTNPFSSPTFSYGVPINEKLIESFQEGGGYIRAFSDFKVAGEYSHIPLYLITKAKKMKGKFDEWTAVARAEKVKPFEKPFEQRAESGMWVEDEIFNSQITGFAWDGRDSYFTLGYGAGTVQWVWPAPAYSWLLRIIDELVEPSIEKAPGIAALLIRQDQAEDVRTQELFR